MSNEERRYIDHPSIEERVAAMEVRAMRIDSIEEKTTRIGSLETRAANVELLIEDIDRKVTAIAAEFSKYKGFIGGVVFTVSALWAVIILGINYFMQK
jgi:hypothetical protein